MARGTEQTSGCPVVRQTLLCLDAGRRALDSLLELKGDWGTGRQRSLDPQNVHLCRMSQSCGDKLISFRTSKFEVEDGPLLGLALPLPRLDQILDPPLFCEHHDSANDASFIRTRARRSVKRHPESPCSGRASCLWTMQGIPPVLLWTEVPDPVRCCNQAGQLELVFAFGCRRKGNQPTRTVEVFKVV